MRELPVFSHHSNSNIRDRQRPWSLGSAHRTAKRSAKNAVITSVLTVAGGAAMWGLLLLSTHLLWHTPARDLLAVAPKWADNDTTGNMGEASLLEMCKDGELLVIGAPRAFVRLQYNFLSEQQLQRLQEHLLVRWPPMSAAELAAGYSAINIDLNSDGWGRLHGSCLRHGTADGEDPSSAVCMAGEPPLSALHDLGQLLRAPWANAWSLNVVYAQPRNVNRAGQSGPQDPHVDNLPLQEGGHDCSVASSETSVLYLQVPKDMQGGHLTVFEASSSGVLVPVRHIQAERNLLVQFGGSASHRVEEFDSASMRISITLEQYRLPPELHRLVPQYHVKRIRY